MQHDYQYNFKNQSNHFVGKITLTLDGIDDVGLDIFGQADETILAMIASWQEVLGDG